VDTAAKSGVPSSFVERPSNGHGPAGHEHATLETFVGKTEETRPSPVAKSPLLVESATDERAAPDMLAHVEEASASGAKVSSPSNLKELIDSGKSSATSSTGRRSEEMSSASRSTKGLMVTLSFSGVPSAEDGNSIGRRCSRKDDAQPLDVDGEDDDDEDDPIDKYVSGLEILETAVMHMTCQDAGTGSDDIRSKLATVPSGMEPTECTDAVDKLTRTPSLASDGSFALLSNQSSSRAILTSDTLRSQMASINVPKLDMVRSARSSIASQVDRTRRASYIYHQAIPMVVPGKQAMHPMRAAAGCEVLHSAPDVLRSGAVPPETNYDLICRLFFDSMPEDFITIESIRQVMQPEALRKFLTKVSEERASVETTFHGTRPELADKVVNHGLDTSICQTGAYGRGAYVGTHAGIAHQYADPDANGLRHMCVVLVVLGSQVVKGREGEREKVTATDRLVNPTQYCFVEDSRLLVSHLIVYRVPPGGGRRRIGGGWFDPFEHRLSLAIRRAANRIRKHGTR